LASKGLMNKKQYEEAREGFLDIWNNPKKTAKKEKFVNAFLRK
jgi:hypothetical protein